MPRDSSGNYFLPPDNPVVDNTPIESSWANTAFRDFAVQFNNLLTRNGLLGPTAQFKLIDGFVNTPGLTFASQPSMGLYRPSVDTMAFSVGNQNKLAIAPSGVGVQGGLGVTGNLNVTGSIVSGSGIVNRVLAGSGIGVTPASGEGAVTVTNTSIAFLTGEWFWDDALSGPVAQGFMGGNAATLEACTQFRFNKIDANGRAYTLLGDPSSATYILVPASGSAPGGKFLVITPFTDNGTWSSVGVSYQSGGGDILPGERMFNTLIAPTGDSLGTVTSFFFTNANGVNGTVDNPSTTPTLTLSLSDIVPASVTSTGAIHSGSTLSAAGAISGANLSGSNSGDQTISLVGDVIAAGSTGTLNTSLATVNPSPGTYNFARITVNSKGLVTSASESSSGNVVTKLLAGSGIKLSPVTGIGDVTVINDQYLALSGHWNWNSATSGDPGTGGIRGNSAVNPAGISEFAVSKIDADGVSRAMSRSAVNDILAFIGASAGAEYVVTEDSVDQGTYITVKVTFTQGASGFPVNGTRIMVAIFPQTPISNGTVTSVSGTGTQGVLVSVSNPTTTPNFTIGLFDITPNTVDTNWLTLSNPDEAGAILFRTYNETAALTQYFISHYGSAVALGNARAAGNLVLVAGNLSRAFISGADGSFGVGDYSWGGYKSYVLGGQTLSNLNSTDPSGGYLSLSQNKGSLLYVGHHPAVTGGNSSMPLGAMSLRSDGGFSFANGAVPKTFIGTNGWLGVGAAPSTPLFAYRPDDWAELRLQSGVSKGAWISLRNDSGQLASILGSPDGTMQFRVGTSSNNAIYVNFDESVGIGTSFPATRLHVSSSAPEVLTINSDHATAGVRLDFLVSGTTAALVGTGPTVLSGASREHFGISADVIALGGGTLTGFDRRAFLTAHGWGVGVSPLPSTSSKMWSAGDITMQATAVTLQMDSYFDGNWRHLVNGYSGGVRFTSDTGELSFMTSANPGAPGALSDIRQVVWIDKGGNMGLGGPPATNGLDIQRNFVGAAEARVWQQNQDSSSFARIQALRSGGVGLIMDATASIGYVGTASNHPLYLRVNSADQLRLSGASVAALVPVRATQFVATPTP